MMMKIPPFRAFTPSINPLDHGNHDVSDGARDVRAAKKPKPTPSIKSGAGNTVAHLGNGSGNPVGKPKPNPGQSVDKEGWPLNQRGQRVDRNGHAINKQGQRINEHSQLIDGQGRGIDKSGRLIDPKGRLINEKHELVNTLGQRVNEKNQRVDAQNRLINSQGRMINEQKQLIDLDGSRVNREGYLVDKHNRPLDKDGKVARSAQSAVMGNNEPHEQIAGMKKKLSRTPALNSSQVPTPPPPKPTAEGSAKSAESTDEVVKTRVIPSTSELASIAIKGAISESAGALAALPVKVAETTATTTVSEHIKAKYLPSPLAAAKPAVAPTVDSSGTPKTEAQKAEQAQEDKKQQALNTSIDNVQISAFEMHNALLKLEHGSISEELVPGKNWSTDVIGRLDLLEEMLDTLEASVSDLAGQSEVYFKAYLSDAAIPTGSEGAAVRVEILERRLSAVKKSRESIERKMAENA